MSTQGAAQACFMGRGPHSAWQAQGNARVPPAGETHSCTPSCRGLGLVGRGRWDEGEKVRGWGGKWHTWRTASAVPPPPTPGHFCQGLSA